MRKRSLILLYSIAIMSILLGIHDGKIALWYQDDPEPVRVFPYAASSLPLADQESLRHGIRIESKEALDKLLADYLS